MVELPRVRSDHLKRLMDAVQKTVPENDPGTGVLVYPEVVQDQLDELGKKTALIKRFESYTDVDDLFRDFSLPAGRRLVYEMEHGKTSNDRQSAAREILNRAKGKPVDRIININAEIEQYAPQEIDAKIESLLDELGYSGEERKTAKSALIAESDQGSGQAEDLQAEPRRTGTILQE